MYRQTDRQIQTDLSYPSSRFFSFGYLVFFFLNVDMNLDIGPRWTLTESRHREMNPDIYLDGHSAWAFDKNRT